MTIKSTIPTPTHSSTPLGRTTQQTEGAEGTDPPVRRVRASLMADPSSPQILGPSPRRSTVSGPDPLGAISSPPAAVHPDGHPPTGADTSPLFRIVNTAAAQVAAQVATAPVDAPDGIGVAVNMRSLPNNLTELHDALQMMPNRTVNPDLAAEVINAVRRQYPMAHGTNTGKAATSNEDLAESISEDHVAKWMEAQGLDKDDVEAMKKAAFWSGASNPFGSDVMTAMSYMVTPMVGAVTGSNTAALAVGVVSAIAAPAVNAFFQSGVVTRGDIYRESKGPTVVLNKKDVNDNLTLKGAAEELERATAKFEAHVVAYDNAWNQILKDHGILTSSKDLSDEELKNFTQLADNVLESRQAVFEAQQVALMTQGSHARQQVGNANQAWPRTMRPIGAGLPGLLSGSEEVGRANLVNKMGGAGVQTGAAMLTMLFQHYAAAHDERNKQMYNNKLNMLYADVFTDHGKEKIAAGDMLTGEDIDPTKLRKLVISPSEAFMVRVKDAMNFCIKKVNEDIEAKRSLEQSNNSAGEDLEAGLEMTQLQHNGSQGLSSESSDSTTIPFGDNDGDNQLRSVAPLNSQRGTRSLRDLQQEAETLNADLEKLKNGKLNELSEKSERFGSGVARGLIDEGLASLGPNSSLGMPKLFSPLARFRSEIVQAALDKKYSTKGEFEAQTIQRLGQAFHLIVAGSAAASVVSRVSSAVVGGAQNASTAQLVGVTAASGVLGGIGATTQYVAISEKNHRRANNDKVSNGANNDKVSNGQQFLNGATAAAREPIGMMATKKAITTANEKIDEALTIVNDLRSIRAALSAEAIALAQVNDNHVSQSV